MNKHDVEDMPNIYRRRLSYSSLIASSLNVFDKPGRVKIGRATLSSRAAMIMIGMNGMVTSPRHRVKRPFCASEY